jgi:protein TonB
MLASLAYSPSNPGGRSRAVVLVVVLHLLLAWMLLTHTGPEAPHRLQPALAPTLIQRVSVAPPAPVSLPVAVTRPEPALVAVPVAREPQPSLAGPREPTPAAKPLAAAAPQTAAAARVLAPASTPTPTPTPVPDQPQAQARPMASAALPPSTPIAATAAAVGTASSREPVAPTATPAPGSATAPVGVTPAASSASARVPSLPQARSAEVTDVVLACPGQVAPAMPAMAIRGGVSGVVVAQAAIAAGKVREVTILSGLPVFHNAVRAAMLQYRCVSNATEVTVTQEFRFGFK